MAILDDLEDLAPLGGDEGHEQPVVHDEQEVMAVTIERVGAARCDIAKSGLILTVKNPIAEAVGTLPGHL